MTKTLPIEKHKGDFSAQLRLLWIALLAIVVGAIGACFAVALLWLIALFTNLFYYHEFSGVIRSPAAAAADWRFVFVPAIGGLIIGLMARYGSSQIRGHGIPEAMEAILIGQSRMKPKVAVLKPISSAISIGSGGPFGAEGPIIMTGGAAGSIIAQAFSMTSAERKTLLVAGAAAGMSATFATPLAAVLLAVELLLFEWRPRSLAPVALASIAAALLRPYLLGPGPLFPVTAHGQLSADVLLAAAFVGLMAGVLSMLLTIAVYGAEDAFARLPIHWMWWPMIGGLVVGIGGYFQPRALGVGYDVIEDLLRGNYVPRLLITLIVVKALIWSISLGSGTSGGVLAPLLMMGGALGAIEAGFLPGNDKALWPLISMAAVLGGTMRAPLTAVAFAIELTYDIAALPALLLASITAYTFSALVMKRSILTEKIARRGYHVSREYSVDPLETLSVGEVMTADVVMVPASLPIDELLSQYFAGGSIYKHQSYPVQDADGRLLGLVTKRDLLDHWLARHAARSADDNAAIDPIIAYDLIRRQPIVAYPWETCRTAALRMAQAGVGRLMVVSQDAPDQLLGIITRSDLLKARTRLATEEVQRDRFIAFRLPRKTG
ncbi:MAG: chloride channel protein [Pirellulales bacterium]|nr:chloride channel protein [Pirellulales bacterium]